GRLRRRQPREGLHRRPRARDRHGAGPASGRRSFRHRARRRSRGRRDDRLARRAVTGALITSAAAKVPLLRAARSALPGAAPVHAADLDPEAIARWFAEGFWAMPRLGDLTAGDVLAYCREHELRLVIPTRDGELGWWAERREQLGSEGVHVLVSAPAAIATCLDKLAFAEALQAAGEPAIPTATAPAGDGSFVVKERFGAGAAGIGLRLDRAAALAHAATLDDPVFQPFVAGDEFSVDLYVARDAEVLGAVARRREVVRNGESQVTATVRRPEL